MLRALRNQTKSVFFKCFLFLLICGFALWGVGDLTGGSKGEIVLSIEDKKISLEDVLNEINRARYMLPDRPSMEDTIKKGSLHNNILNKLEQEILINKEANYLNLKPLSEKTKPIQKREGI